MGNENTELDGQATDELDKDLGTLSPEENVDNDDNLEPDGSEKPGEENSEGDVKLADEEGDKHINQEAVNKKINKVVYEKKQAQEQLEAETQKRIELEEKLSALTKVELPDIPPVPDYMDDDYDQKLKQRDDIIRRHATDAANKQALETIRVDQARADETAEQDRVKTMISNFDNRTVELKLDKEALVESQNVVGSFLHGKRDLARFLLADADGPLNVLYLSQNATELEKISKMPETDAAVYIATKIAPEAAKLKPKTTETPDPHYSPSGKSKIDNESPELAGCTFV